MKQCPQHQNLSRIFISEPVISQVFCHKKQGMHAYTCILLVSWLLTKQLECGINCLIFAGRQTEFYGTIYASDSPKKLVEEITTCSISNNLFRSTACLSQLN